MGQESRPVATLRGGYRHWRVRRLHLDAPVSLNPFGMPFPAIFDVVLVGPETKRKRLVAPRI